MCRTGWRWQTWCITRTSDVSGGCASQDRSHDPGLRSRSCQAGDRLSSEASPPVRAQVTAGSIATAHGPSATGFLGSTVYETLDSDDGLVEIADWESAEAQADAVQQATAMGVYAPVVELWRLRSRPPRRVIGPSRSPPERTPIMWAQLIETRVRPDVGPADVGPRVRDVHGSLHDAEQPGSGLIRTLAMQDQSDPHRVFTLVVFESEEMARARELDPRREPGLQTARAAMAELFDGAFEFTDLTVLAEWAD